MLLNFMIGKFQYERAGSESSGFAGTNQSFGNEVKHIR